MTWPFKYIMMDREGDWHSYPNKQSLMDAFYDNCYDWCMYNTYTQNYLDFEANLKENLKQIQIDMPVFEVGKKVELPWKKYFQEELKERKQKFDAQEDYKQENEEELEELRNRARSLGYKLAPRR